MQGYGIPPSNLSCGNAAVVESNNATKINAFTKMLFISFSLVCKNY